MDCGVGRMSAHSLPDRNNTLGHGAMRCLQQLTHAWGRHRPAEQKALRFRHSPLGADEFKLFVGFDAFDNNRHAEIGAEARDATQQSQRPMTSDVLKERPVDLHLLKREVMQIAQARSLSR